MHTHLVSVAASLTEVAEQQLTYPVLRYFHTVRRQSSPAVATLVLADTLFLLSHCAPPRRAAPGLDALLHSSIAAFVRVKQVSGRTPNHESQVVALRAQGDALGLQTHPGSALMTGLPQYLTRRDALVSACRDDGWGSAQSPKNMYQDNPS